MEKLGLISDKLKELNPRLIYYGISGFGRTGPEAERGGFHLIAHGMAVLVSINGECPGRPPVKVAALISDINASILAAMGVCAAYSKMLQTDLDQKVDTSLFETAIIQTYWQSAIDFVTGHAPQPLGSAHLLNSPFQAFQTKDGSINIGPVNQNNQLRVLELISALALHDDQRFSSNAKRMKNLPALIEMLNAYLIKDKSQNWLKRMEISKVPAGPINHILQMYSALQVLARDMVIEFKHKTAGKEQALGHPLKFSKMPARGACAASILGYYTQQALSQMCYKSVEIRDLYSPNS